MSVTNPSSGFASMRGMRIAIVTDAWKPQVNGVVQTLSRTRDELLALGHEVLMVTPDGRRTIPCPTYPEIRLALFCRRSVRRQLRAFAPDCVHIATEGPLGLAARRYCLRRRVRFITSYHTQFPEYVRARAPIPIRVTSRILRWFHGAAEKTLVPTERIRQKLIARGFRNVFIWSRGVDAALFTPHDPRTYDLPRPIWIHMGRIAVEKNIEAFLALELPGSKVVIGDGLDRQRLESHYPEAHFVGNRFGTELASYLAGGDVFVFPSRTDTFGLVLLEAMACGLPVAAFPVDGPIDVVSNGVTGVLDDDLASACVAAQLLNPRYCREHAERRSWRAATRQLLEHLASPRTTRACAQGVMQPRSSASTMSPS
jgi:glycosyltransferase involved in cell wall biosynthesis